MVTPLPLSLFLIVKDEADRIGTTLRAVEGLADEIIIVDSGSTDSTQHIAARFGRVIFNPWQGYGPQKRFAEEQCRNLWLLNLDADEVMPPELAEEIRALFANGALNAHDGYKIPIAEVFPGETKAHPLAYTLSPVRLYRRDKGRYAPSPVHDRVEMQEGSLIGTLKGVIQHFSVRSLGDQIAKLNRYSDQQADDLAVRGIIIPNWRLFVEFPAAFLKAYFGRRHCLRGVYGFLTAMNYAIARHLRLAKYYERRRLYRNNDMV
jgi:glycosyltransferase involved in cell wall biosynthesis